VAGELKKMTDLNAAQIRRSLATRESLLCSQHIEVFATIDSTNTYLKDQPAPPKGQFRAVVAAHQTDGRGRQGKKWLSSPGSSLCLSLAYRFQTVPSELPSLTLALGIGVADVLTDAGVPDVRLKWPNDLLVGNSKLGGILTETLSRGQDDVTAIVGIGINVSANTELAEAELSPWAESVTCLAAVMSDRPTREHLCQVIIDSLMSGCIAFESGGFESFADRFAEYDWLSGKSVLIDTPDGDVSGRANGIAADGALLIDTESGPRNIYTGSVRQVASRDNAS
jgi:BirA family biotin operon repressor/biotin-[acetyl-CoA-carboxylase] ligase